MAEKEENNPKKPKVHPDLKDFDIEIDSLGKVTLKYDIEKLNAFLDRKVPDKKFKGIKDLENRLEGEDDIIPDNLDNI